MFRQTAMAVNGRLPRTKLNTRARAQYPRGIQNEKCKQEGSITMGKLADFVVLSDNLVTIDPDLIKDVTVMKTYVGGKVVYEAP